MNPQTEQPSTADQNPTPTVPPAYTQPIEQQAVVPEKKRHKGLALLLLIGPSVLLLVAIILSAVSNFAFSSTAPTGDNLFPESNPVHTIINTIVFLMGAVTVITWLPGIIIGIILLNKK
jgi:hypothetical protein